MLSFRTAFEYEVNYFKRSLRHDLLHFSGFVILVLIIIQSCNFQSQFRSRRCLSFELEQSVFFCPKRLFLACGSFGSSFHPSSENQSRKKTDARMLSQARGRLETNNTKPVFRAQVRSVRQRAPCRFQTMFILACKIKNPQISVTSCRHTAVAKGFIIPLIK